MRRIPNENGRKFMEYILTDSSATYSLNPNSEATLRISMSKLSPDQWQVLSPHLDRALEMTDEERSTWLSSLQIENPVLASQLELFLQEHHELISEGFLESSTLELPGGVGLTGQTFGVYTLVCQIGHGGMGTVWLAERNDGRFERRVAVKILNVALMGKAGEERFKREGHILGRLSHPHIAELIDAGVSPAGQPFLVIEYVEGEHIDVYCDQNGLGVRARVKLLLDTLRAVEKAHANLIVHRDLKPSNILVRTDGQAKLLDFGIAKLLSNDGKTGDSPLTLEGGRALTPEYAAPEQLRGEPVTPATDVYASGVLLYVLLTGHHPAGDAPRTPASLVKAILDSDPARPSEIVALTQSNKESAVANAARRATTPDKLARSLRGDLDTILTKSLKENPQERYTSIKDFADDLQRHLRHQPISARPDTIAYRTGKFVRRHRSGIAATLLATLALVGTTFFPWFFPRRNEPLPQFNQQKLTANAENLPVFNAAISPDGKYLGYADPEGIHLQFLATGGVRTVALPSGTEAEKASWTFGSWYPDSERFVASVHVLGTPSTVWSIPAIENKAPQKLAEVEDMFGRAAISPNGLKIAYERRRASFGAREIWVMGASGESPQKILTAQSQATIYGIAWSPTGNRIAYLSRRVQGDHTQLIIESCDLTGGTKTTILSDNHLSIFTSAPAFTWMPPRRFIYSRNTERGSSEFDNLWELQVDADKGTPQGKARQLTDWSGFAVFSLSATSNGKQLAFLRGNSHASVFVGDLANKESRLVNARRLTLDDNYNLPSAWTPDSREIIFSSEHASNHRVMYRQAIDPGSAPQLVTPSENANFYLAGLSPDRTGILLEGEPLDSRKMGLYRVDPKGGAARLLFNIGGFVLFSCSDKTANLCVFGRPTADKSELDVVSFDPLGGPGKEMVQIPLEVGSSADIGFDYWWQLSPDGTQIGIVKKHGNQIRLVPLSGGPTRTIRINNYPDLMEFFWAIDSQSVFVSTVTPGGAILLHVSLSGEVQPMWHRPQSYHTWGFPSPDGHHLAIMDSNSESNVWIINNF
jgi:serine/threonine protein kinase/Tol biopolymer transport system component